MAKEHSDRVCPVENAGKLDSLLRRLAQNPRRILKPYVKNGFSVLDFRCGPGFFTVAMAQLVGADGKVYACDLQEGMLDILRGKIFGSPLQNRVFTLQCNGNSFPVNEQLDFILAFYVVHEVPDKEMLFAGFRKLLKPGGKLLMVEPKGHVSKSRFDGFVKLAEANGFNNFKRKWIPMGMSVILS